MSQSSIDAEKTGTRKRDYLWGFRRKRPRSTSPLGDPVAGPVGPAPELVAGDPALLSSCGPNTSPRTVSGKSEEGSLWARALSSINISDKDRDTLDSLSGRDRNTPEGNETTPKLDIEELLDAVRAKRKMCLDSQWEFEFRGRAVNLRDQADNIISWLAKFKEIGDIAIQKDPGHAALPWAGIRFMLQMAIAERDQMGLLLTGVERLTNITSRCRIYEILYLDGKQSEETGDPIKPAFENLSAALISLYTVVLRFLAKACRALSKSGTRRALGATFNPGMFEGLMEQLQALDAEVVASAANCKEACNRNASRDMGRVFGILGDLEEPVQRIDLGVMVLLKNVDSERRTKILQWISAVPYEDNHNTACMGHTSGTGEWLLQHDTYINWRESRTCGILWLYGIPGAGKTKLVSTVVSSLRREIQEGPRGEALVYFYCDRNQPDRQSHEQVIRSFVRQLSTFQDSGTIPSCIAKHYAEKENPGFASSGLTFQECCTLVTELLSGYVKVTLVLDALDECDRSTRHILINEIDKLVSGSTSCVIKVFISSRPDKDIKHRFRDGPNVGISATDNGEDIRKFIVDTINNSPPDWREELASAPGLREEIVTTLHEKADGMFQWAKLQMDQLLRLVFVSDIREFLGKLPKDLKRAYDGIMGQINSQEGRTPEIARRAFLWVMCSQVPLTPGMLADAVRRDPETGATYPVDINIHVVLEACRNLVLIDQSGFCRFSHLSVQEYLETWCYSNGQAHLAVGLVSLQVLLDPMNWERIGGLIFSTRDDWQGDNILEYTVVYWSDHVRLHATGHIDDRLALLVKSLLGSPSEGSSAYARWRQAFIHYLNSRRGRSSYKGEFSDSVDSLGPAFAVVILDLNGILQGWWTSSLDVNLRDDEGQSLLYIAGLSGNLAAAAELLDLGAEINAQGGEYGNALQAAAWGGSEGIVSLLLDRGAKINAQGGEYGNTLQAAAWKGSEVIVRLLLDRGAKINAQGGQYGNALQAAASQGSEVIVRLLLDRGAEINAQGGEYGNALQAAAWTGSEGIVSLLLDRGAEIYAQGGQYGNALQAAAWRVSEIVARLLLDRGAEINAQGGEYGNALQAAAWWGTKDMVSLLLDRGAEINAQGGRYGNALQAAAGGGRKDIVSLLLDRGAEVNAQGGEYGNALQAAAWQGRKDIVSLLLDRRAEVNAQGGQYGNALQAAAWRGRRDIVHLLLDRGAEINAQGGRYGNALQAAAWEGSQGIVSLLLDRGAEVNAQGGEYGSAPQAAAWRSRKDIVSLLLNRGADVNIQGGKYGNALQAATWRGRKDIASLLLDRGAEANAMGGQYGSALQAAAWRGRKDIGSLLLDRGAEVNAQGGEYGSALQAAAWRGRKDIVSLLLDRRAEINAQGGKYGNALQAAAWRSRKDIVSLLLDRGAEANAQGGQYGNALQAAAWRGRKDIVSLLLSRGAEINAQGGQYGNALQVAAWRGRKDIVGLLLDRGAEINSQGGEYGSALRAAAWRGSEGIASLLLDRGADVSSLEEQYRAWCRSLEGSPAPARSPS